MMEPERTPRGIVTRTTLTIWAVVAVALVGTIAANGAGFGHRSDVSAIAATAIATPVATPIVAPGTPSATPEPTLTADQLRQYQPNELGKVMVLMFHGIDYTGSEYSTTPEEFQSDLEWLYSHNFYVIPIHDYITDQIKAPAGKRPVVLTFDDGTVNQFNYLVDANGTKTIDPKCAIGILEAFFSAHPDFGRGGLFSILPLAPFSWPDHPEQEPYEAEKIQFLVDHGYEIGNHTVDHTDLGKSSPDEIKAELAGAVDMLRKFSPQAQLEVIAMPFGDYPKGGDNQALLDGFDYNGKHYSARAALMVGSEPAPAPVNVDFEPMFTPRVRGTTEILKQWFDYVDANPGIIYVSDGNPDTLTIPEQLVPGLTGKLDDAKAAGKTVIRY